MSYAAFLKSVIKYSRGIFLPCVSAYLMFIMPACAGILVTEGVPSGFEQLDAPRQTSVTLYYGGNLLGVFPAHFAPGKLQFDHPEDVVEAVPTITDRQKIIALFKDALPAHAERLCNAKRTEDCDTLAPEIAGVIFDENRLKAELFINKNYLSVVDESSTRYLPLPERHFSSVYAFSGAVSGTDTTSPNFTLTDNANYGYGETKFTSQTTASNLGLRFDTAAASIEREGQGAAMGLFRSRPMQLLADRDIAGVAVFSSSQTIMDSHKTEGNDIIVYLPRRAFVSLYREGHLYSSRPYEAGNQRIDTSELPDGAYEITMKIQEADGSTREEKRFFAKTQSIPPPGVPIYYMQAGIIRNDAATDATIPRLTNDPILRMGLSRRIDDNIGLSVSALGVKDRGLFETGLFWINPIGQMTATALTSTHGDYGVQTAYVATAEKISLSFDARDLWLSKKPIPGYEDLAQQVLQATTTLRYAITPDISFGLRGSYARESDSPTTISYGPYAEWDMWRQGESSLGITADMARTNGESAGNFLLHFTHRLGNYGVTATSGYNYGGNDNSPSGSARVWHDDITPGNSLLVGGGISGDKTQQIASADANWRNHFGQMQGGIQETFGQNGNAFNYGGNFAFDAAQLSDEIYVGGDRVDRSAVIIDTSGDVQANMHVFVNSAEQSTVTVGDQRVIYLSPFHIYNIRLVADKDMLLDYDSNDRKVTLYPGNVVKMQWSVNKFYVVVARIQTPDGQPLKDAILQESHELISTDSSGHIQAEISKPEKLTFTTPEKNICQVLLPPSVKPVRGILIYHEALTCVTSQ